MSSLNSVPFLSIYHKLLNALSFTIRVSGLRLWIKIANIQFEFSHLRSFTFLNWVLSGFCVRVLLGKTRIQARTCTQRDSETQPSGWALGSLCGMVSNDKFNSDAELQGFWFFSCWFWQFVFAVFLKKIGIWPSHLNHRWQTQGPRAESGPPPCFIRPGTLFLPGSSTELLVPG